MTEAVNYDFKKETKKSSGVLHIAGYERNYLLQTSSTMLGDL
jgi:hypothetical protein